ncbi:MAG: hypothetical protein IKN10_03600 [Muribaculaceae bacterium]|nr:hypothetical protein [Muribaculaceae bacterium]
MKKFLFTLLALFMASTAFATNEYFYMDDIQVTKSFLAQTGSKARDADIPVKAHFEARVSAWQVDLTLPEGVTLRNAKAGSDMTLHTLDAVGNDKAIPVEVNAQTAVNRIIVANAIAGYYYPEGADPDEDDPVTCGAAKWEAGEYEMMMIITLRFSQDFTGGEITVQTAPSSGQDPRGGITDGLTRTSKCQVTVVDDETFSIDPTEASAKVGETINVTATVSASDATLSYTGATVTATAAGFDITSEEAGVFTVTATATIGEEKTFGSSKWTIRNSKNYVYLPLTAEGTYTFEEEVQPKDLNGTINISDPDEDGKVTVTYTPGEGDPENVELAVVVKDKDGKVVENAYADGVITLPDYGEYTVTVTASATGYNDKTFDPETVTWNKKAVGAPVINYETYDTEVVVTITWPTSDGDQMYNGQYSYPRTNVDQSFDVEAYVTEGETCQESAHATETIPVPKKEVIAKPTITFSGEETTTMTVTVSCETPGVTLYVNGAAVEGNPYSYTVTRDDVYTAGTVEVTAVAKKGDLESETAEESKDWVVKDKPKAPEATKTENVTDTQVTVNFTPAEGTDTEVSVKVGDETVTLPYVIDRPAYGEEPITVTFVVTVTGDNYTTNTYNVVVTVQPQEPTYASKPKITFTPDNGGVTVKIEDYTEYTIKVNGTQVDPTRNEHNYYVEKGDVEKNIEVYAKNAPENMIPAETTATYKLAAKTVYNTPNPVIGEPTVNDDDVTFTVTGEGTVTVTVTNGDKTETYTGTGEVEVTIPRTDKDVTYTVNATAKSNKEGYDVITEGTASATVTVPALQTEKPTITYKYGTAEFDEDGNVVVDGRYATITITNNDEKDAVIEYSLDGGETWNTYNPDVPVTVSGVGTHTVMARAKAEGKALSEVESVDIKIDKTTSVNELVNGKTVAGVRYFNMAGQEMQEANGITIVVTTYTDGTTSAVKVIK